MSKFSPLGGNEGYGGCDDVRNYAALSHEYLEEMAELTDQEFGRLVRFLLRYSMTGEESDLPGNERFFAKRVMAQEGRYQKSYEEQTEKHRRAAQTRWDKEREMQRNASHCNTETETNTETKTKIYPLPSTEGKRRGAAASAAERERQHMERLAKDALALERFAEVHEG